MVSANPDWARKIPDSRHPEAISRVAAFVNCGVSTLAVRLKMCVGELLHGPSSASSSSFAVGRRIDERHGEHVAGADVQRGAALTDETPAGRPRVVGARADSANRPALERQQHAVVLLPPSSVTQSR